MAATTSAVSTGSLKDMDTRQLLTLFPEEIWKMILSGATNCQVAENLYRASPFFGPRLAVTQTTFLFHRVWPILSNYYEEKLSREYDEEEAKKYRAKKCKTCELPRRPRVFSGLLKLRLVCHTWCKVLDEFYETHPKRRQVRDYMYNLKNTETEMDVWQRAEVDNYPLRSYDLERHFSKSHSDIECVRSPLVWRAVRFILTLHAGVHNEASFLRHYGQLLHNCHIRLKDNYIPRSLLYNFVRELLELMPNLRVLHLANEIDRELRPLEGRDTERHLESDNTLAAMPTLTHLQFFSTTDLHSIYFEAFMRANPHVSSLQVQKVNPRSRNNSFISIIPSLCTPHSFHYDFTTDEDCLDFLKLSSVWPLKQASLLFHRSIAVKYQTILNYLKQKCGSTLEQLLLRLPTRQCPVENDLNLSMNLSCLKRLKLRMINYRSLDFLLPLKDSLEFLFVGVEFDKWGSLELQSLQKRETQEPDQVLWLDGKPVDTDLWRKFCKLKTVVFELIYYNGEELSERKRYYGSLHRHQWLDKHKFVWKKGILAVHIAV